MQSHIDLKVNALSWPWYWFDTS